MEQKFNKFYNGFCKKYLNKTFIDESYALNMEEKDKSNVTISPSTSLDEANPAVQDNSILLETIGSRESVIQAALRETESTQIDIHNLMEKLTKGHADLEEDKKKVEADFSAINEPVQLLSNWLALSLKKITTDELEVRFASISPDDPHRQFSLALATDGHNRYIVTDREGGDKDFDSLVIELNQTNDLRGFLIKARQRYLQHAKADLPKMIDSPNMAELPKMADLTICH